MRKSLLIVPVAIFGLASSGNAQTHTAFSGDFDPEVALVSVYGSLEWQDRRLSRYDNFDSDLAFVEPLFDAGFTEAGVTKHVVIATLTPRPKREFSCHACSPLLGGAVFRRDGNRWVLESAGEIIESATALHSSLELVQVGPERFAVLHQVAEISGGSEWKRASLIFGIGDTLAARFESQVTEGPGPGACAVPEPHLIVTTVDDAAAGSDQEYFDLILDAQWNEARCRMGTTDDGPVITSSGEVCQRVSRYRFQATQYALLSTEIDSCTPLPETTVSLRG